MPLVRPFRGIGYALDRSGSDLIPARIRLPEEPAVHPGRVADLTDLVSPPFDVISPDQRRALLERESLDGEEIARILRTRPFQEAAAPA